MKASGPGRMIISLSILLLMFVEESSSRDLLAGGFDVFDSTLFPYYIRIPQGEDHFCGGSLVAPDMVLTLASCTFENLTDVEITVGWKAKLGEPAHLMETFTHPLWNDATNENGFSLLKISNASSNDIVMLSNDSDSPHLVEGNELTVLGATTNRLVPTLASVTVTTIANGECSASKNDGGFPILLSQDQFCAGDASRGFCHDDYGGPMVVTSPIDGDSNSNNTTTNNTHTDNFDVQVGVAAWTFCGITGNRAGKSSPGVYLRVSDGFDWIRATICLNSEDPPLYFDCPENDNSTVVVVQEPTVPPSTMDDSPSPIPFRYEIANDGFLFEVGILIEKIIDLETIEVVHYIVPGALLPFSVYAEASEYVDILELERDALYAFSIVDGEADGVVAGLVDGSTWWYLVYIL
jgi:trypsin